MLKENGKDKHETGGDLAVLILILMEHAQRDLVKAHMRSLMPKRLNPYFNGTCSKRCISVAEVHEIEKCLNPYFNGTCSKRTIMIKVKDLKSLSLNPYFNGTCSKRQLKRALLCHPQLVLILILMEHAQRENRHLFT